MSAESVVRDPHLAPQGRKKIEWARSRMPVLDRVARSLAAGGELRGRRVGICLHLEAKTACLALALRDAGAEVAVCASNPLSTQDDVAAALAAEQVRVFAWRGATPDEYAAFLRAVIHTRPEFIIDDGGDLTELLHREERDYLSGVVGGAEETTTGVHRLQAMARAGVLAFPVFAVNDSLAKFLFDNRYGTGQSVWDGIMRSTNLLVAGKVVVVVGYGWCGKGVAMRARGLGARTVVCEVDPVAAAEALMDGHQVLPMDEAARVGDVFVTVTGNRDVIRREHFLRMKDGALLANAGHFDVEICKPELESLAATVQEVRPGVREYRLGDGRRLYLLGDGRLVNLVNADGHPVEIMDMSFAVQVLALRTLAREGRALPPGVHRLPRAVDEEVCALRLEASGVRIDRLTEEQLRYLSSW